jgi:hypothetical protein
MEAPPCCAVCEGRIFHFSRTVIGFKTGHVRVHAARSVGTPIHGTYAYTYVYIPTYIERLSLGTYKVKHTYVRRTYSTTLSQMRFFI